MDEIKPDKTDNTEELKVETLMHQLRAKLVRHLLELIESGQAKPADLAVATKFLRDNEITADPMTDRDAEELAEELEELKNLRKLPGSFMMIDDVRVAIPAISHEENPD